MNVPVTTLCLNEVRDQGPHKRDVGSATAEGT